MEGRTGRDGERCPECDQPIAAIDRFCGRCGAHLPPPRSTAVEDPPIAPARVEAAAVTGAPEPARRLIKQDCRPPR